MPDQLDHAKVLEMQHRKHALEEFLGNSTEPPQQIINGQVLCIDCDSAIQPKRLQAKPNAARCIHCQHKTEKTHGRY